VKAFLYNKQTCELSPVDIDGYDSIRQHFRGCGNILGKTIAEPVTGICLREYFPCDSTPETTIVAAYDRTGLQHVDLPIGPEELRCTLMEHSQKQGIAV
jgi:hypothetical protein